MRELAASARAALAGELVRAMPDVSRELAPARSIERIWASAPELRCRAGGFDRGAVFLVNRGASLVPVAVCGD